MECARSVGGASEHRAGLSLRVQQAAQMPVQAVSLLRFKMHTSSRGTHEASSVDGAIEPGSRGNLMFAAGVVGKGSEGIDSWDAIAITGYPSIDALRDSVKLKGTRQVAELADMAVFAVLPPVGAAAKL